MIHALSALQKAVDGCANTAATRTGRFGVTMVYRDPDISLNLYYGMPNKWGTLEQRHVATYEGTKRYLGRGCAVCTGTLEYSRYAQSAKHILSAFKGALTALGYRIHEEVPFETPPYLNG